MTFKQLAFTTVIVTLTVLATVESFPFDQGKRLTNDRKYYFKAPWKSGIVPYYISTDFESSQMDLLRKAMDTIESVSCVKFVPLREAPIMPQQDDYIYLLISRRQGQGCRTATLEYAIQDNNGIMELMLDTSWCMEEGKILHELMHSLGFSHEHQRPDRDDYINIVWDNLENVEEAVMQFSRSTYSKELLYDMPYDLLSIMHYARKGYVVSPDPEAPVIVSKTEQPRMGQRDGLSDLDIKKINYSYSCGFHGPTSRTPTA